jgi:signal transduction histidine kinase
MNSLRARLLAGFLLTIFTVLIIVGLALLLILRDSPLVERQVVIRLNEAARAAIEQQFLAPNQPFANLRAKIQNLVDSNGVRILITTNKGEIQFDSSAPDLPPLNFSQFRLTRRDPNLPEAQIGRAHDTNQQTWVYVARPFGPKHQLIFAEREPRFPLLAFFAENLLWPLLEAGAVAALLAVVLAVLISRSIALPLQKMASVAHHIAQGDYGQAAPVSGPGEVQELGRSLNQMAQQVQASQAAQRDFLANVSHDLKTPLTSIQGFAQALLDGTADSPEAVQRSANIIHAEAERMRRLVESLLALARLDAGLKTLQREPLEMRLILTAVVEKFSLRAQEKGLTLQSALPATLPALIGDGDRLAQVFTNLLDNALKHTPAGGRVSLTAHLIPDALEIAVKDTGSGLPPAELNRIFERFYQVDKSRARSGGLGLGLAICKEIVEAHHGTIWVESIVGVGSSFVVRLPTVKPGDVTFARARSK